MDNGSNGRRHHSGLRGIQAKKEWMLLLVRIKSFPRIQFYIKTFHPRLSADAIGNRNNEGSIISGFKYLFYLKWYTDSVLPFVHSEPIPISYEFVLVEFLESCGYIFNKKRLRLLKNTIWNKWSKDKRDTNWGSIFPQF